MPMRARSAFNSQTLVLLFLFRTKNVALIACYFVSLVQIWTWQVMLSL